MSDNSTSFPPPIEELQMNEETETAQNNSNDPGQASLSQVKSHLRSCIEKLNEVCQVNNAMLSKISELVNENNKLYDEIEEQKIEIAELNQYGRRENVEICGIPDNVTQNKLEGHVISLLKSIGVTVTSNQIHSVHRIGKSKPSRPRNVIVRFVNRKHAFSALKNKKKLNSGDYKKCFIIENLCPYNKKIFTGVGTIKCP